MMCQETPFVSRRYAADREKSPMFDIWVKATLQQRFDQDLDEPLSDELVAILTEDPEQRNDH